MKKYIPEHKVQRMRNIITKDYGNKTKIQIGYGQKTEEHIEGDIWTEGKTKWTVKNGITQTVTKLDKARKLIIMPLTCPKCNSRVMRGELDKIFWKLHAECSNCRISHETNLKIKNKLDFKKYEKDILVNNYTSWIEDLEKYAKDYIDDVNRDGYITEAGKVEDWSKQNKKQLEELVESNIKNIKKDIKKKFDGMDITT